MILYGFIVAVASAIVYLIDRWVARQIETAIRKIGA